MIAAAAAISAQNNMKYGEKHKGPIILRLTKNKMKTNKKKFILLISFGEFLPFVPILFVWLPSRRITINHTAAQVY